MRFEYFSLLRLALTSKLVSYPTVSSSINSRWSEVTRSRRKESPVMIEGERYLQRSALREQLGIAFKDCARKFNAELWCLLRGMFFSLQQCEVTFLAYGKKSNRTTEYGSI